MPTLHVLTDKEKAWVEKNMPDVDINSVYDETYDKIKKGMEKEQENTPKEGATPKSDEANDITISEDKPKEQEENKQETSIAPLVVSEEGIAPVNEEQNQEISNEEPLYDESAETIFRRYATTKDMEFVRDESEREALVGHFEKDGEEKGKVTLKGDHATSDIAGIEALVFYAKEKGLPITLGECSDEYKAEMEKFCEQMQVKLMYSQTELPNTEREEPRPLSGENDAPVDEQNKDNSKEGETAIPLPPHTEEQNTPNEIEIEEAARENGPKYRITSKIASVQIEKYMRNASKDTFAAETAADEKLLSEGKYKVTGEEKAAANILMKKYAIGKAKGDEEMASNAEKALQYYGVDNITFEPKDNKDGKVVITEKPYSERTADEKAEIKAAHEKLLSGKTNDTLEKTQQNQPLTKDGGGR